MFFSVTAGVVGKRYEVLGLLDLITSDGNMTNYISIGLYLFVFKTR